MSMLQPGTQLQKPIKVTLRDLGPANYLIVLLSQQLNLKPERVIEASLRQDIDLKTAHYGFQVDADEAITQTKASEPFVMRIGDSYVINNELAGRVRYFCFDIYSFCSKKAILAVIAKFLKALSIATDIGNSYYYEFRLQQPFNGLVEISDEIGNKLEEIFKDDDHAVCKLIQRLIYERVSVAEVLIPPTLCIYTSEIAEYRKLQGTILLDTLHAYYLSVMARCSNYDEASILDYILTRHFERVEKRPTYPRRYQPPG